MRRGLLQAAALSRAAVDLAAALLVPAVVLAAARLVPAVALATALLIQAPDVSAQQAAWQPWHHLSGIVDIGARSDGSLVAMAAGRLYLVSRDGTASPFAAGPDGFSGSADAEPYFVLAPGLSVDSAGCAWHPDDLFVLDLASPPGVIRVDPAGHATPFSTLAGVDTLGGIAMDATGAFGHRLLVTGTHADRTTVFGVDCQGASTILTDTAPPVEGGLAVAPATFGEFAGYLIAPDENSGHIWAIAPNGNIHPVSVPDLPAGGDTGVESLGFVSAAFLSGGSAYLADRATANNPFPGTDNILSLGSAALVAAGVQAGDLLVATEGGGTTVAVHCGPTCSVTHVALGTPGGHIEGHLVPVADQPSLAQ